MNSNFLYIILLLLLTNTGFAQPPRDWVSTATNGGSFDDYVEDVFVDNSGNVYVCGTFNGSLVIGGNTLSATPIGQAFVAKYDNLGNPLWAINSSGDNHAYAKSIFVDALGNVYVAGYHTHSTISFAGTSVSSSSNEGFFILKTTPNGTPIHMTGPTFPSTGKCRAYAIDGDGDNVYIAGLHKGPVDLPGGVSVGAPVGMSDVFIARVDSSLSSFDYAISHGGTKNDYATGIRLDGNDLFATGNYGNAPCTFFTSGTDYVLPNYGQQAMWACRINNVTGDVNWATSAGSAIGPVTASDIDANSGEVFVTGHCADVTTLVESPSTSGPFTYNDTIYSKGGQDIFVVKYNQGGSLQTFWSEGGTGNDQSHDIAIDLSCNTVQICGSFEDSVNFGATTPLLANDKDAFVAAYDNSGNFNWVFKEASTEDVIPYAISTNSGKTSVGGALHNDTYIGTDPITIVNWNGYSDHFVEYFDCSTPAPCRPTIDDCASNDTVTADLNCTYVLGNYTAVPVTDGCMSGGITVTQSPPPLSILNAGIHEIALTAEDGAGKKDVCFFDLIIEINSNSKIVECGDSFTAETTGLNGNNYNSFSCSPTTTNGQDQLYQITVTDDNYFLNVKLSNVIDSNDPYAYVYWLGDNCVNDGNCVTLDSFNVSNQTFSNNSQYISYLADGPGTYYLLVDSKTDSIESYDISFSCSSSGVEFETTNNCSGQNFNLDGYIPYKNGSSAILTLQPCETVTLCHELFLSNANGWEWIDSVEMKLGDCYENINTATLFPDNPPGNNGFVDLNGDWDGMYNLAENSIVWEFNHSSGNIWGDGSGGPYTCYNYSFCFDADISATCANEEDLNIGIIIGDDSGKDEDVDIVNFSIVNSDQYELQDDNPYFSYASPVLCQNDPNVLPDSITTSGGSFTADPGIVFTDGSPSPTGEIDLTASTVGGPYTVTYTVGLCPYTKDTTVEIQAQQDPSFSYSSNQYCQGDSDPVPTVAGTTSGLFTGPTEIVFVSSSTGEIDLSASTVGGPYYIKYTTPGPYCVNTDSFAVTIDAEDDPSFNYSAIDYCKADSNPVPATVITPGGVFSESSGTVSVNSSTGEVDLSTSPTGNYYITYTTSGICPNTDSVEFNIHPEDDPSFLYDSTEYCQGDMNPIPTITGTAGGSFTAPVEVIFVNTATGEINLSASTAGGPYTITYTTPGPLCPNIDTFDITIYSEDDPAFSYSNSWYCQGDTVQTASISGTMGGTFTADTEIDLINATTGAFNPNTSTTGGPYTITYTTPGPYCPNTMDFNITLYPEEDPSISYSDSVYCSSDVNPVPTIATAGGTFNTPTEIVFSNITTGEIDLNASTSGGPYNIIYTTPGPECPNTDTFSLSIIQQDQALIEYGDTAFCTSDGLIAPTLNGTTTGLFTPDNNNLSIDTLSGEIDLSSSPQNEYVITFITSGQCPDTNTVQFNLYEQPIADAGDDQELFFRYETLLDATPTQLGNSSWTLIEGNGVIVDDTDPKSAVTDLINGSNVFEWSITNGSCPIALDQLTITINDLFIPEAITPNNDGNNDVLLIEGISYLDHKIEIFNRWGQKVYESEDYQNDWNGVDIAGNELSADTYFYIIHVKDKTFKGYIVIRR